VRDLTVSTLPYWGNCSAGGEVDSARTVKSLVRRLYQSSLHKETYKKKSFQREKILPKNLFGENEGGPMVGTKGKINLQTRCSKGTRGRCGYFWRRGIVPGCNVQGKYQKGGQKLAARQILRERSHDKNQRSNTRSTFGPENRAVVHPWRKKEQLRIRGGVLSRDKIWGFKGSL